MNTFLTLLISLTLVVGLPALAEESHSESGQGSEGAPRKISETKLSESALNFLEESFALPVDYLKEKFEPSLPNAIEKALKGEETEIVDITSFLMARINKKQRDELEKKATEAIKQETEEKDPEKRDERRLLLMNRLLWGSKLLTGKGSDKPEAQAFNKLFDPAYAKEMEKNEVTLEKLKQAAEGNEAAKKWVAENVNVKAATRFAEAQKNSGNGLLAERVVGAFSSKSGKQKFLDLTSHDGEPQRLYLGEDSKSLSKAVDEMFKNSASKPKGRPGFGGARFSLSQNDSPKKSWFVDDKGKFTSGTPAGFTPPPPPTPARDAVAEGSKVFQSKCLSCHGPTGEGGLLGPVALATKLRKFSGRNPEMPPAGSAPLSDQEKSDLTAYFQAGK